MNRIEEIKVRHKQDEIEHNKVSQGLIHEDRGYLLQRLERYETALKEISRYTHPDYPFKGETLILEVHTLIKLALKEP